MHIVKSVFCLLPNIRGTLKVGALTLAWGLSWSWASGAPLSQSLIWTEVAPGVWKGEAGQPETLSLLQASGGLPKLAALAELPVAPFPFETGFVEFQQLAWKCALRLPLAATEDTFAQYHYEGTPVIRPLQLVGPQAATNTNAASTAATLDATHNPYETPAALIEKKDQYLLGDSMLVAPLAPSASSRHVVLPAGRWYDFYTGKFAGENQTIEVSPPLDRIPLFVRNGAIIPRLAGEPQRAPRADERPPLELWHYGDQPGTLHLYDDDGETFAHERGISSRTTLHAERTPDGNWRGHVTPVAGQPA